MVHVISFLSMVRGISMLLRDSMRLYIVVIYFHGRNVGCILYLLTLLFWVVFMVGLKKRKLLDRSPFAGQLAVLKH